MYTTLKPDRNRQRTVVFYGRVSTEHEAQISALENQLQWYDDQAKQHKNWNVIDKYIDEGITGTQAKKRPSFLQMIEDARQGKFDLIVTREVCRFARNTVDTLTFTRELKNLGIEVYFVEDNIWTMDGDGELRLTLMATLAQDESRKISERVRAGQYISRENGVLYGNGNILGYDRVGSTYVINPEQAETVRMIFDMYLQGMGSMKIMKRLTALGRKNSSGIVKWDMANILRIISNATYKGYVCYNKSHSNNYLEQKRIVNQDDSTFLYKKGDFEPIVSEEIWDKCNAMRKSKTRPSLVVNGQVKKKSHRTCDDVWQTKMVCSCGSSFRKDLWYRNKQGETSYGYNCYNKLNSGSAKVRRDCGQSVEGFCERRMIPEWKMELMSRDVMQSIFKEKNEVVAKTISLIRQYYKAELKSGTDKSEIYLQAQLAKAKEKKQNILDMRAEGELTKEEYTEMRKKADEDILRLEKQIQNCDNQKGLQDNLFDSLSGIEQTLKQITDFDSGQIDKTLIAKVVESIEVVNENKFIWNVRCSESCSAKVGCTVSGRKNKAIVNIEDFEGSEGDSDPSVHKNSLVFKKLHRLLLHRRSNSCKV